MSDTSEGDFGGAPAPVVVQQAPVVQNPRAAERFIQEHDERRQEAASNYDDLMKQRQDAIARTRAILDQTISDMRQSHQGTVNLPLLAMGAGMLQQPQPGVRSNFFSDLGSGFRAAGSAIQHQRMSDQDFYNGVAQLQAKQAELGDLPLKDAAALAKAREISEGNMTGSVERALITSKADQARSLGFGIIQLPDGRIVNAVTQQPMNFGAMGTDAQGKSLLGSDVHGDDYLKSLPDASARQLIKSIGDYDYDMGKMTSRSPVAMAIMGDLLSQVKQYNPTFDAKNYGTIQKGMASWTGTGINAQQQKAVTAASEHMGNLQSTAAGLNNTDFQLINKYGNMAKAAVGSPRIAAFLAAKQAAMTELSAFLGKGHPAEGQIMAWSQTVDAANTPQQLQAALEQYASIMHGQAVALARNKTSDYGNRKTYNADDIFGQGTTDRLKSILSYDIATEGGRFGALRRGENDKLTQLGATPKPNPTQEQWQRGAEMLRKNPKTAAQFDEHFGPGSAAMVLGR